MKSYMQQLRISEIENDSELLSNAALFHDLQPAKNFPPTLFLHKGRSLQFKSPLSFSLLKFTQNSAADEAIAVGFQTLRNSRIALFASDTDISDESISKNPSNLDAFLSAADWSFGNLFVLEKSIKYARRDYKVNDLLEFQIQLTQVNRGVRTPFLRQQLQIQLKLLDFMSSAILLHEYSTEEIAVYSAALKLPGTHGIYKVHLDYKENGYSYLTESFDVTVRPLKASDTPKDHEASLPYYASIALALLGSLWICAASAYDQRHKQKK